MIDMTHVADYPQPADTVFAALTDLPHYPAWQSDVIAAEAKGGGELALGSQVAQIRKVLGRKTNVTLTVTAFEPGALLVLRTAEGVIPSVEQTYRVAADDHGSTVEFRLQVDGVPRMAEHLAKAQLGKQVPKMFESLGLELQGR